MGCYWSWRHASLDGTLLTSLSYLQQMICLFSVFQHSIAWNRSSTDAGLTLLIGIVVPYSCDGKNDFWYLSYHGIKFLVPALTVRGAFHLEYRPFSTSISGFYYICLDFDNESSSSSLAENASCAKPVPVGPVLTGFYYHPESNPEQILCLSNIPLSFSSVFEFRWYLLGFTSTFCDITMASCCPDLKLISSLASCCIIISILSCKISLVMLCSMTVSLLLFPIRKTMLALLIVVALSFPPSWPSGLLVCWSAPAALYWISRLTTPHKLTTKYIFAIRKPPQFGIAIATVTFHLINGPRPRFQYSKPRWSSL